VTRLLVSLILLAQGIPVQQGGTVTGVLRDRLGMPVPGVRIAAVARQEAPEDVALGAAMAGLAETDAEGRFTLENIPPGRYYIAAGRLDLQTYYPGTQEIAKGTIVTITAGATVSGITFAISDTSVGRAPGGFGGAVVTAVIPVRVTVENGGKLPVTANGRIITILVQSASTSPVTIPIDGGFFSIPGPVSGDFRVTVDNLPDSYVVKSMTYGSTDITRGTFHLNPANFAVPGVVLTGTLASSPSLQSITQAVMASLRAYTAGVAASLAAPSPPSNLSIVLGTTASRPAGNVRVTGTTGSTSKQLVYISGRPGVVFSDGTFEFRGVPPGRHLLATGNNSTPLAAVVVVGDKDMDGVELKETAMLPSDMRTPKDPSPAGDYAPGTIVPLARVTGTVVEETSRAPITEGEVVVKAGNYSRTIPIDTDGRFQTFYLLPGTYELRLQVFGHSTTGPTIVVDDKDLTVDLTTRRLY
jgi:Carboxypeptidase regulatory-like domain